MKYSSRFFLYAPLALFLALAVTACSYWWVVANALSKKLDTLNGHTAIPGITLSFASKTVSGFPFNLDVVFKDFRVTVDTPHGPSTWSAEDFALHALTYGRDQMLFEAAGHQALTWHDLKGGTHTLPFQVGELHASSIENEHGMARIDIDCIGFGSPALTAARLQLHMRVNPNGRAIDVAADGDAVHLSPPLVSLFGDTLNQIRAEITVAPSTAFAGLRTGHASWVDAVEGWRTAGGTADVSDFQISWTHVSGLGKGRLSLDENHFLSGLLDFKIAGMEALIEDANHRGLRGAPNGGVAAALLDRAAKAGSNQAGMLGAVIGFHGEQVFVGDEPAATMEPVY
ncbi:MAG TPA: DUF2125 domain-containing protein [Rhizomicrobium sp.]|nr:DUF2125 domain-containing protein [Rhizomicrobium sp.]